MKKIYTEEQKTAILQRYWSGEPVTSITADTMVAKSLFTDGSKHPQRNRKRSICPIIGF